MALLTIVDFPMWLPACAKHTWFRACQGLRTERFRKSHVVVGQAHVAIARV